MPASQVHGQFQVLERKRDWEDDMCVLDTHIGIMAVEIEALRLVKFLVGGNEEKGARL